MGFCILGGKENYLRKVLSDKLTSLGESISIGAAASAFSDAIQSIYTNRYADGQDSLKVSRKLTLTSSQTGSNVNITDNWYTTCDASAVYNKGKADATIANVDAQKITVYCHCEGHTSTTGANVVRPNATLTVTLPNGSSGTRTVSGSVNTDGEGSKSESNITVNTWLTINSFTAYDAFRSNSRMDVTFTVKVNGTATKVHCTLKATNAHQSGSADWYSDATSTRYIVANGTTVYQKLAVSSSTAQML